MAVNVHNLRSGSRVLVSVDLCNLEFLTSKKFCTTFKSLLLVFTNIDRVIRHIILSFSNFLKYEKYFGYKSRNLSSRHWAFDPRSREYNCIVSLVRYMTHCGLACASVLVEFSATVFGVFLKLPWKYKQQFSTRHLYQLYCTWRCFEDLDSLSKMLGFYRIKLDVNQESINLEHKNEVFSPHLINIYMQFKMEINKLKA